MPRYNPSVIEPKWQKYWEENRTFAAPRLPGEKKMYVLDMFPYPSANGLHVGHPEGYTATDIVSRFNRMNGVSVMHPMGWDAFGLPAEQYAKKTGIHPRITTEKNVANFRRQLKMLGFSYDWDRELATTDVDYFHWTQKIFLVLYDTWYDPEMKKGRPISELPIPADVKAEGEDAVCRFIDDHRLAYQQEAPVNWCPILGTVLANEEIIDGKSERGGHPVIRIPMRQWMLRITAYADRLAEELDELDWPESVKLLQRNWIGRSTGGELDFFIGSASNPDGKPSQDEYQQWLASRKVSKYPRKPGNDVLRIYTTRPDTLFGATYMVISPEHALVSRLTTPENAEAVKAYCAEAAGKSDLDRTELAKEKTGIFTGSYAINPVNGALVPIWVADYVLAGYGTGAIMAVPAHDTRDFDFAKKYELPIIQVVEPVVGENGVTEEMARKLRDGVEAFTVSGTAVNSGQFNGMATDDVKNAVVSWLVELGLGKKAVNYKLRDWLFSRQHIWGEPFPLLHELDENGQKTGKVLPLTDADLPVNLPEMEQFDFPPLENPEPPMEHAPQDWLFVELNGKKYKRETNSMPQWAGSCWYYLRYLDPKNAERLIDPEIEKAWMPVDLYIGGAEHAVLHLLYARFWHKVLFDRGYVTTKEPFHKLVNQGMILGEMEYNAFQAEDGTYVSADKVKGMPEAEKEKLARVRVTKENVEKAGEYFVLRADKSIKLDSRAFKMSKSRGNVINPDDVVKEHGADSLRMYEMFMGPLEAVKPWSVESVSGVRDFLGRVWRMIIDERADEMKLAEAVQDVEPNEEQNRVLHKTIKAVRNDIQTLQLNTAIARMMEFQNFFSKQSVRPKKAMEQFVLLLSPYAPHIAEELWEALGHGKTLAYESFPMFDESAIAASTVEVTLHVCGKLRSKIQLPAGTDAETTEAAALQDPKFLQWIEGKTIVKKIVIPSKMVNYVVK
ncbi:MAG: leucine--tRNA ligase [Thermoguttaceae bacterium]|nr:leucine--tRNA ligase [Thermoguttaceae bacterium]MDO4425109.1 leucine--tRNA ligase [Planctomycetia bacterium]